MDPEIIPVAKFSLKSSQTETEISFIPRQIQPPTYLSRIVVKGKLIVNFNLNSNKG